ncbi:hypothetical protein TI03_03315, partial [Achromatium sp. WMS1]
MPDPTLLESAHELITLAGTSIQLALAESSWDVNNTLEACQGNIEVIAMAADTAQLEGLQQLCIMINENLKELIRNKTQQEFGNQIMAWVEAVQTYVQQPTTNAITPPLLALVPEQQREDMRIALQIEKVAAASFVAQTEEESLQAEPTRRLVKAEDLLLTIDPDIKPKLIEVFFREAPANAAQFNAHISQVLQGQELAKHLAASQRLAHNIKG